MTKPRGQIPATGLGHGNIGQYSASTGDGIKASEKPKIVIFKEADGTIVGSALGNKFGPWKR